MVASKVIMAVVVVSAVAFVQIEARPSSTDSDWTNQFETLFSNLTAKVSDFVGNHSSITETVKSSLNTYADNLKEEVSSIGKKLESTPGISDLVKNATQQYHSTVDSLAKNLPVDLTPQKLTEKFQEAQKTIVAQMTDLNKKVQGNTEWEKEIKEFTKKQYDAFSEQIQSYQKQLTEAGKQ